MSDFSQGLRQFADELEQNLADVFNVAIREVKRSVVEGSEITGAAGQPVDTGKLKASWADEKTGPLTWEIDTSLPYAPIIEYNVRGAKLISPVGGFHSVDDTVAGWDRIVDAAVREVAK